MRGRVADEGYEPDDFGDGADEYGEDDDDGGDTTVPCPYCRGPVFEDAERCPACGQYVSREDVPWRRPWWLVAGVAVCLVLVLRWVVR